MVVSTYHGDADYIKQLEREIHEELSGVCWQYEWFYGGPEVDAVTDRLDRQFFPEKYTELVLNRYDKS